MQQKTKTIPQLDSRGMLLASASAQEDDAQEEGAAQEEDQRPVRLGSDRFVWHQAAPSSRISKAALDLTLATQARASARVTKGTTVSSFQPSGRST